MVLVFLQKICLIVVTHCDTSVSYEKVEKVNRLVSRRPTSIVVKALWPETLATDVKQWHRILNKQHKKILNYCIRYLNNTLSYLDFQKIICRYFILHFVS
jgi:DNA polymerase III gamma/tau subunit